MLQDGVRKQSITDNTITTRHVVSNTITIQVYKYTKFQEIRSTKTSNRSCIQLYTGNNFLITGSGNNKRRRWTGDRP